MKFKNLINSLTETGRKKNFADKHAPELIQELQDTNETSETTSQGCETLEQASQSPLFIKGMANIMCIAAKEMLKHNNKNGRKNGQKQYGRGYIEYNTQINDGPTQHKEERVDFSPSEISTFTDKTFWSEKMVPMMMDAKIHDIPLYFNDRSTYKFFDDLKHYITRSEGGNSILHLSKELKNRVFANKEMPKALEENSLYHIIDRIRYITYDDSLVYDETKKDYKNKKGEYMREENLKFKEDTETLMNDITEFKTKNGEGKELQERFNRLQNKNEELGITNKMYVPSEINNIIKNQ